MSVKSFYSYRPLLGSRAVFNFLVALRGNGKTYGAKLHCIKRFLKYGEEFIYLRRYKSELSAKTTFFTDIAKEFPGIGFRIHGNEGQICRNLGADKENWVTAVYFVALSQGQSKKSMAWPNVHTIIFDEFIIEKGMTRYLPSEVDVMLNFYSTVDRYQDRVKILFLANAVSIMNPYFLHFDINPAGDDKIHTSHDGFIAYHFPDCDDFQDEIKSTRFGRFIDGTAYADYAVKSEFRDNTITQIAGKESSDSYLLTLETVHGAVSIWRRKQGGYYVSQKRPKNETRYTLIRANAQENNLFLENSDPILLAFKMAFSIGKILFDQPKTRNMFLMIFERR